MRDILKEIKNGTYKVSISRAKKLLESGKDFLDTSFTGNMYTSRGAVLEEYLFSGRVPHNFKVIPGKEPDPFSDNIWSLVDALSFLIADGQTLEEAWDEAVSHSLYKVSPIKVRQYFNPYKDWFRGYMEAVMEGKKTISESNMEIIKAMTAQFRKEPELVKLLKGETQYRIDFESRGWKCKGFLDIWNKKEGTIVDFKTSKNPPQTVPKSQRYDLQGSFYNTGIKEMGHEVKNVIFVICSTVPPFKPHAIRMTERDLEIGRKGTVVPSIHSEIKYGKPKISLVNKEVLGYEQLLDKLTWHVENGFDKEPGEDLFINSNIW